MAPDVVATSKDLGKTLLLAAGQAAEDMLASVATSTVNDLPAIEASSIQTLLSFVPSWGRGIAAGFADSVINKGTPQLTESIKSLFGIAMLRIHAITGATIAPAYQPAGNIDPTTGKAYPAGTVDPRTGHPYGAIDPHTGEQYPVIA